MNNQTPSSTANIVARNIAFVAATKETAKLIDEQTALINSLFVNEFSSGGKTFLKRVGRRWFQTFFRFYERLTIPGLALHQALRKICIEHFVRESIAQGFEQVVVLGGGLDTLALRLHKEFSHVNFIELDHPATQRIKRETIEKHRLSSENLKLVAVDFTHQTFAETLQTCASYQPQLETVFICEGVLMYLELDEVDRIFNVISEQNKLRRRFIFTFMEPDKRGQINFRNSTFLVQMWLKWKNEPFKWGISQNELKDFLTNHGFSLKNLATPETFRRTYLKKFALGDYLIAEGENICICDEFTIGNNPSQAEAFVDFSDLSNSRQPAILSEPGSRAGF